MRRAVADRLHIVVAAEAGRRVELGVAEERAVAAAFAGDVVFIMQHNRVAYEHRVVEVGVDLVGAQRGVGYVRVFIRVGREDGRLADVNRRLAAFLLLLAAFVGRLRGRLVRRRARVGGVLRRHVRAAGNGAFGGPARFGGRRCGRRAVVRRGDAGAENAEREHGRHHDIKELVFHFLYVSFPAVRGIIPARIAASSRG